MRLFEALRAKGLKARADLVQYYDDETFHGEIPTRERPFRKRKRFAYQREYRICVVPEAAGNDHIMIEIGDITDICMKIDASRVNSLLEIKLDQDS